MCLKKLARRSCTECLKLILRRSSKVAYYLIKGGTRATNPYKDAYDIALAEKIARTQMLEESKIWSTRFNPRYLKMAFLPVFGLGIAVLLYVHFIAIPKRMLGLKQRQGMYFKDLERKGFLKNWIVEEYHDDIYDDGILKEIEEMANIGKPAPKDPNAEFHEARHDLENRKATNRAKMDVKLNELYKKRKDLKLD